MHCPGKLMGKLDALSHHPPHPQGQEDNLDATLLNPDQFELWSSETTLIRGPETELLEHIKQAQELDEPVVKALKELDAGNIHMEEWQQDGRVVLFQGHIYVPKDPQLCL